MNVFYNIDHLSFKQKIQLLKETKKQCFDWHVDKLDCSISWARQKIKMSFSEFLKKIELTSYFTVILRRNDWENYLEIAVNTSSIPDYFLWILLNLDKVDYFVKKYKLIEK